MRKAIVSIFLTLTLLFPAITAAQEVTEAPTDSDPVAEVTPEPAPPSEELPTEPLEEEVPEEDGEVTADELTAIFGIPPSVALVFVTLAALVIGILKTVLPNEVGGWEITSRGISLVVSIVAYGFWWVAGRFSYGDQFLAGLQFIIDLGPTIMTLLVFLVGPAAMYIGIFKRAHVPFFGDSRPTQDEITSQARNRNKAYESAG